MAPSNKRLLDVLARHQVYVEGVKADYFKRFNPVLDEIQKEIRFLFSKLNVSDLSSFTKRDLNKFIIEVRDIQKKHYNVYTETLLAELVAFMQADNTNLKIMFATLEQEDDTKPVTEEEADIYLEDSDDGDNMYPVTWFTENPEKLWSSIINAPVPANGMLLSTFIVSFTTAASTAIENIIRKGYANHSTVDEVLLELFGSANLNFRNGATNRILSQSNAVTATILQHISSIVQGGIGSIIYGRYRWVSVIDNSTTDICRSRNNKVFKYGAGPLPPAHIGCRSKTVPVVAGNMEDVPTYYAWMKDQPKEFLDDVLGSAKADALLSGATKAKDMPQFSNAKAITLKEYSTKLDKILSR